MIEAYEKLRDQMAAEREREMSRRGYDGGAGLGEGPGTVERMFDVWLRALYEIHDEMTGGGGGGLWGGAGDGVGDGGVGLGNYFL
jgi:hypothetical protein